MNLSMSGPALSLCMIVKDEASLLPKCLASVRELKPEIIIVDTGSTDQTVPIAQATGARVLAFDFTIVDFSAARNFALAQASARWILVLDADEVLEPAGLPLIERITATDAKIGYFLERHNFSSETSSKTVDHVVRLFPNRGYRYRGRVHETVDASLLASGGELRRSEIQIRHSFISTREARIRKNFTYIQILKEEIAADPDDDSRLDFLAAEYHQLEMFDEATAIAEQIARVRPLDARAHLFAGTYHLLFKPDFRRARADFNTALKLKPGYAEAESFLHLLAEKESSAAHALNDPGTVLLR